MIRRQPMTCHKYPGYLPPGEWVAEEKYDGHRMLVEVTHKPETCVVVYSRAGNERQLPPHLIEELRHLPAMIGDGELVVPGEHSANVTEVSKQSQLVLWMFDCLELDGCDLRSQTYRTRSNFVSNMLFTHGNAVQAPMLIRVVDHEHVMEVAQRVWDRDGEGLVLKRVDSVYQEGKRSRDWLKLKRIRSAVLTVIGFESGLLGPHSIVLLEDSEGFQTSVKVLDDASLAEVEADPERHLGRKLMIEYQERTPDGAYRHPRWDRWEDQ